MNGEELSREVPSDAREVEDQYRKLAGWVWPETIVKDGGPHAHWRMASKRGEVPYVSPYAFVSMGQALQRLASVRNLPLADLRLRDV